MQKQQTIASNSHGQTIMIDNSYSQPYQQPALMTYPSYGCAQPVYGQPAYGQAYPQQQGPIIIQRT